MRVAVVFFSGNKNSQIAEVARGIAAGIEKAGHHVDLVDGDRDVNTKLTGYEYIAVGAVGISTFGGRISSDVAQYLSRSGMVGGKKSFAFTCRRLFGATKVLRAIMNVMEHEGMFVRYSEVLRSRVEAELVATRLKLDH